MAKPAYSMIDFVWFRLPAHVPGFATPFYLGRGLAHDIRYDSRTNPQMAKAGYYVLKIALSRGGRWGAGERSGELAPGQGVLRQWTDHTTWDGYNPSSREAWEFFGLIFHGQAAADFAQSLIERYGPVFDFPIDCVLGRHLLRLAAEPTHHVEISTADACRLVNDTLATLLQTAEQQFRTRQRLELPQAVEQAIVERFRDDLSVAELAQDHQVSREHLTRAFTQAYGVPPHQYLMEFRVREACRLLRKTELPVKQVMRQAGFNSRVTFLRVFRRVVGITPTEYRQGHSD